MAKSKDYKLEIWADGFGVWYARADFTEPGLGNTGEAERVLFNARRGAHWAIKNAVNLRQGQPMGKLKLEVIENKTDLSGIGRLVSITWKEKGE
jgi:hypothetical protein